MQAQQCGLEEVGSAAFKSEHAPRLRPLEARKWLVARQDALFPSAADERGPTFGRLQPSAEPCIMHEIAPAIRPRCLGQIACANAASQAAKSHRRSAAYVGAAHVGDGAQV